MANAIFTTKVTPTYDDLPEVRYHFPKTYYNQALRSVGDWIIYYEPRRESFDLAGRAGRSAYFATAKVSRIEPDKLNDRQFYAFVTDYIEFTHPVPFRVGELYPESGLKKHDGSTNKGLFGRAVRNLPKEEYELILQLAFGTVPIHELDSPNLFHALEDREEYGVDRAKILIERTVRDAAFSRSIRELYGATCALTGLKLINGGGRCEIEAAHIRPVAEGGPDSSRNGLALSRTVHWLFDRGIVSLDNDGRILAAHNLLPEPIGRLLNANRCATLPADFTRRPHPVYLDYHRNTVCRDKDLRLLL